MSKLQWYSMLAHSLKPHLKSQTPKKRSCELKSEDFLPLSTETFGEHGCMGVLKMVCFEILPNYGYYFHTLNLGFLIFISRIVFLRYKLLT